MTGFVFWLISIRLGNQLGLKDLGFIYINF